MASKAKSLEPTHSREYDSQHGREKNQGRASNSGELEREGVNRHNNPHTIHDHGILERLANLEREHTKRLRESRSRSRSVQRSSRRYRSRSPRSRSSRSRSRGRSSRRHRPRSFRRSGSRDHRSSFRSERRDRRHYSGKRDSRKRERSRSQSDRGSSFIDSEGEYSDSTQSDRSNSRDSRKRRNYSESEGEGSFPYKGETYVYFDKRRHSHVDSDSSRILWDGELHPVKWHPNCSRKAFCLVSTSSKAFPYMDKAVAHDTLLNNLKVTPSPGENPGLGRKGFSAPFDPNSGLGMAMDIIMKMEKDIIHCLLADNEAAAMKVFQEDAFVISSMATFPTAWPK